MRREIRVSVEISLIASVKFNSLGWICLPVAQLYRTSEKVLLFVDYVRLCRQFGEREAGRLAAGGRPDERTERTFVISCLHS